MKSDTFAPEARATLIGSLPMEDHEEATRIIFDLIDEIPLWAQLPCYEEERLISQFAEGLPGLVSQDGKIFIDRSRPEFEQEMLSFFEDYLSVTEGGASLDGSRFAFSERTSKGFDAFLKEARKRQGSYFALKGQVTGPFTMLTGLRDQEDKPLIFDPILRDAVTKAVAMKARFQVEKMKEICGRVLLFLDEPALAGFGSSAMVGIDRSEAVAVVKEAVDAVQEAGGLCGVHVCANTDWPVVLETGLDILSFDAFGFFDKIILYEKDLVAFLDRGGCIAFGLVPTLNQEDLEGASLDGLLRLWDSVQERLPLDEKRIAAQSLITPSCGTGLLPLELAEKALSLTSDLSRAIRERNGFC